MRIETEATSLLKFMTRLLYQIGRLKSTLHIFVETMYDGCMITYDEFEKVDIRSGTIVEAEDFPEAKKPAYKLTVDFGPTIGRRRSSAQVTHCYTKEQLLGKQVIGVVNFPKKRIAHFESEVLILGFQDHDGHIVLVEPTTRVPNGQKLH